VLPSAHPRAPAKGPLGPEYRRSQRLARSTPGASLAQNVFHSLIVTSDLAPAIPISDHGRGRDGWHKPNHRIHKLLFLKNLVSKLFDIKILRGISR